MEDELRDQLNELIQKELVKMDGMSIGTEEYETASQSLERLYKLALQDARQQAEYVDQMNRDDIERKKYELDKDHKTAELREQCKSNYMQLGLSAATALATMWFYNVWMKKGFQFEETGTFTSTTLREIRNKIPKPFSKKI